MTDRSGVVIAAPPRAGHSGAGLRSRLLPLAGVGAGAVVVAVLAFGGGFGQHSPMALMFPAMMLVSVLVSLAYAVGSSGRAGLDRDRDHHLAQLRRATEQWAELATRQRDHLLRAHPPVDDVWAATESTSESVRIGVGPGVPDFPVECANPRQTDDPPDPVGERAVEQFLAHHTCIPDLPVLVDLLGSAVVAVDGPVPQVRAVVRNLVCRIAMAHTPAEIAITAVVDAATLAHWDWLKWLPHNPHPGTLFAELPSATGEHSARHLVVVLDQRALRTAHPGEGVTVLTVGARDGADASLHVEADSIRIGQTTATPDLMTAAQALTCARRLAARTSAQPARRGTTWPELMRHRAPAPLCIPIGVTDTGDAVSLDIREAADGGVGPHGLCIGATGSGKSELLKTVAVGMIAAHGPEDLNLILIDFKGGAAFLDLDRAPHVSAIITNLADEAHLVDRMQDALTGEIHRRQQVLRAAGNLAGMAEYRRARDRDPALAPLPTLLVIVDEFAELLTQHPEFADVFAAIGRLGRSLGIHLLLASQRLDEGRLRGLESHLSYRICLKTLSAAESRAVLGVPDAYDLPRRPGSGYLQIGATDLVRFTAAHVSAPAPRPSAPQPASPRQIEPFVTSLATGTPHSAASTVTILETVLTRVADDGPPAHPVWLPPLATSPTLDAVLDAVAAADLRAPIGVADRVFEQRRVPVVLDLTGGAGNVAVIGAPQSGKSTTLRTLALALAETHSPRRIQMYCLDFGGGGLGPLRALPHVGAVAGRRDTELAARTVAELTALVRRREALFTRTGVDSMAEYRRTLADGTAPAEDVHGDVLLFVDGWAALRQTDERMEAAVTALASEGLSVGVHVVIAATRWADLRPALRDQIGTRIELRLSDPLDSEIDRRRARNVPADRPGVGLTPDGMPLTVALPRLDGVSSARGLADATQRAGQRRADQHPGERAPQIRVLPTQVPWESLAPAAGPTVVPLGWESAQLATAAVDFAAQPHLLVLGDPASGKTAVLRLLRHRLARERVLVLDPRHTPTGECARAVADLLPDLQARIGRGAPDHRVFIVVDDYDLLPAANPLSVLLPVLPHARDIGLHLVIARRSAGAARALYDPVLSAVRDGDAAGLQLSTGTDEGPLLASSHAGILPPGRGRLITRARGEQLIQVAWCAP